MPKPSANHQPKKKPQIRKQRWQRAILSAISKCANVSAACKLVGIDESNVYVTLRQDPEFKAKWDQAMEDALDALECEVYRRAHTASDRLAELILTRRRPAKWGDKAQPAEQKPIDIKISIDGDNK